jgi:hypothetical protein
VDESTPHEYTAALRVLSETIPLAELEAGLGTPTRGHDKGDPVSRRYPDGAKRPHASWILESTPERTEKLDRHIDELVGFAETHRDVVGSLRARDARVDVYCGILSGDGTRGGFTIHPSLSQRLGALKLPLAIEIY